MPLWVLSKSPRATRLSNRVGAVYTFNVIGFIRRLRKAKLFISGGGNLIQDDTSTRSLYFYLFTIMMGKLTGHKVMMYGCGVGPVSKPGNIRITARCLNRYVDHITLRERESYGILEKMGVYSPEISLAADPALNLRPKEDDIVKAALDAENIPPEGNYLCVSVRNWPGFGEAAPAIAEAVDYACAKYGFEPVFLPIELSKTRSMDNDQTAVDKVASYMKTPCIHKIRCRYDAATTIGIIARMKIILSMRLHALVFAAGQGVPAIAVSYGPKVKGFMNYMGQDKCMDVGDTDEALLKKYIDELVSKSQDNEESVKQVNRLREMEFVNVKVAKELLGYE
jgi:polysaccharide pyruvyl transferase CsaB